MIFYLIINSDYIPEQKLCLTKADFRRELRGYDWTKLYRIDTSTFGCLDITRQVLEPLATSTFQSREPPAPWLRQLLDAEGIDYYSGWPESDRGYPRSTRKGYEDESNEV